jgi:hypothetical protein
LDRSPVKKRIPGSTFCREGSRTYSRERSGRLLRQKLGVAHDLELFASAYPGYQMAVVLLQGEQGTTRGLVPGLLDDLCLRFDGEGTEEAHATVQVSDGHRARDKPRVLVRPREPFDRAFEVRSCERRPAGGGGMLLEGACEVTFRLHQEEDRAVFVRLCAEEVRSVEAEDGEVEIVDVVVAVDGDAHARITREERQFALRRVAVFGQHLEPLAQLQDLLVAAPRVIVEGQEAETDSTTTAVLCDAYAVETRRTAVEGRVNVVQGMYHPDVPMTRIITDDLEAHDPRSIECQYFDRLFEDREGNAIEYQVSGFTAQPPVFITGEVVCRRDPERECFPPFDLKRACVGGDLFESHRISIAGRTHDSSPA